MKHAILVIGYGNSAEILQKSIDILDSYNIDFFIHWDARYNLPQLSSVKSHIFFLKNRVSVKWGSWRQIEAELLLLKAMKRSSQKYDYIHLISSNDIPLMDVNYFEHYFKKDVYLGFDTYITEEIKHRISYFYPNNVDFRKHVNIQRFYRYLNILFHINRLKNKNIKVEKGPNWFSIKGKFIDEILNYNNKIFEHSLCGDEIFLQTILSRFKDCRLNYKDVNEQALRYIDWKRGRPYIFSLNDVEELREKLNTHYAFARKVKDAQVVDRLYESFKN